MIAALGFQLRDGGLEPTAALQFQTMARPSKYSEEIADKICMYLHAGNPRCYAYGAAGIDAKTFGSWLKKNADFKIRVEDAEAKAPVSLHNQVVKAAHVHEVKREVIAYETLFDDGKPIRKYPVVKVLTSWEFDPNAAKWLLERRWPEHYKLRQDITSGDKPVDQALLILRGVSMDEI